MKGIILAGGSGSRMFPITKGISKQLLPVYDKPMIYYSLSVLMLAGIRDILIISSPSDIKNYEKLLSDGSQFGISLSYRVQNEPKGIAEAFLIGESFIENDSVSLILGDNVFYGQGFSEILKKVSEKGQGATIFGYQVKDPERFGVVEFDESLKVLSIEEKPEKPKSDYAVTGLYFYDQDVVEIAKNIKPSERGELEITTINNEYLRINKLEIELLGRGFAWLDTGTHESLLEASAFIQTIQNRQGLLISSPEEISLNKGWLSKDEFKNLVSGYKESSYSNFLKDLIK